MAADIEVTILGAGSIGLSFAAVMAGAGCCVTLVEPDAARRDAAPAGLALQAEAMGLAGLSPAHPVVADLRPEPGETLARAALVLDCGTERLEFKRDLFTRLLALCPPQTLLATASSAIPMSQIVPDPALQARCLVAHPVNPPAVLRVVELCPAPGTSAEAVSQAAALFAALGFTPVRLGREVEGFVLNRLQGAVLREAYRLVDEGVIDVAGIEAVMRLGLGPRWALSGPFETAELNTPGGIRAHAARMGPAYARMGAERGEVVDWHPGLIDAVEGQRRAEIAAEDLPARAAWRAKAVARLVAKRDELMQERP